ncbi:MAG TPA: hypothetical protein VMG38_15490 [Trebonia sp.]|nr:hypothetical protein [Trebonia sp.]
MNKLPTSRLTSVRPVPGGHKALAVGVAAVVAVLSLAACGSTGTSSVTGTTDGSGTTSTVSGSAGTGVGTGAGGGTTSGSAGLKPGLALNPASGPVTKDPAYSSPACPSGHQGSGVIREVSRGGATATFSITSNAVTAPFTGTLYASLAQLRSFANIPNGGTQQVTIVCFSGPSEMGSQVPVYELWVTYSADGKSYTTSSTKP